MKVLMRLAQGALVAALATPVIALAQAPGQPGAAPSGSAPQPNAMTCPCGDMMQQSTTGRGSMGMPMMSMHQSMHGSDHGRMGRQDARRGQPSPQSAGRVGDIADYPR